jgi:hypothetical protein
MKIVYMDRVINRLEQLVDEIQKACNLGLDYYDRLREFKHFCDNTPMLAYCLAGLPQVHYDFAVDRRDMGEMWPGGMEGYGMRWNAIGQIVDGGPSAVDVAWLQLGTRSPGPGIQKVTELFVIPIYHFLVDQLESSGTMLYVLLRYKRWAEWFEAEYLRDIYGQAGGNGGEDALDENLRRFLFESGIDYPFSQPASPRGRVDVVAGLETDDPLVLEIKVWDSSKGYRENRVRDGLRQVMDYTAKFGKDKGHVVVFNLDQEPLSFVSQASKGEWPPRIEHGGRTYFFIDVHIAEKLEPISQQDKGKPVRVIEIDLAKLLDDCLSA